MIHYGVGDAVGKEVGKEVGMSDGLNVGSVEGACVGNTVGLGVGSCEGDGVGLGDGKSVGQTIALQTDDCARGEGHAPRSAVRANSMRLHAATPPTRHRIVARGRASLAARYGTSVSVRKSCVPAT